MLEERLVHVTRHFADQVFKNFFSRWTDLNRSLDAAFDADYEFDAFLKKTEFWCQKLGIKLFKNRILNFLTKKFFQKISGDIAFDAEFHSLQNGLFSFNFRS